MNLILEGIVTIGDAYRNKKSFKKGYIHIEDVDLVLAIDKHFRNTKITFTLTCEEYTLFCEGRCLVDIGYINKEYPMEPDFFYIDKKNILSILKNYDKKKIKIKIESEWIV